MGRRVRARIPPKLTVSEHEEQVALITWARASAWRYPELRWLYAVPNGGERHPAVAMKMKAEGVLAGVPDLCLPVPRGTYHGAYVEMKREGGRVTFLQSQWGVHLAGAGYAYQLAQGFKAARDFLLAYLDERLPKEP